MSTTYENSMPAVEVRNKGLRPALSQFTAAVTESIKFHNAINQLVPFPEDFSAKPISQAGKAHRVPR